MKKLLTLVCAAVLLAVILVLPAMAEKPYVAYWSFDENAVETYNGYTPSNPEAFKAVEGKHGKAYAGAGADASGVIRFDNVDIPLTTNFTASCWAKGDFDVEAGSYYVFMAKNEKNTKGHFEFYWFPDGAFGCYGTNQSEACNLKSSWPLDDAEWHHFTVRVEGTTYKLYIDGELDHTYEGAELKQAEGPLFFGSLVDDTLPAQTEVDDMFFTDYLVPEEDIEKLMEDTKAYADTVLTLDIEKPVSEEAVETFEDEDLYVAYWDFEADAVDQINGLAPTNPETLKLVDGKNGKSFSGEGGVLYYDADIPITHSGTMACWVKDDGAVETGGYYVFAAKNAKGTDGHLELYWEPEGKVAVYGTNSAQVVLTDSGTPFNDNAWHHVALVEDKDIYTLYIDGAAVSTCEGERLNKAAGTLAIGGLVDGTLTTASQVDDLFIANRALSAEEVAALMADSAAAAKKLSAGEAIVDAVAEPVAEEVVAEEPEVVEEVAAEEPAAVEEVVVEEPEVVEEAAETVAPAPAAAPQTFDAVVFAALAAVLSAAGYAVSKKH